MSLLEANLNGDENKGHLKKLRYSHNLAEISKFLVTVSFNCEYDNRFSVVSSESVTAVLTH